MFQWFVVLKNVKVKIPVKKNITKIAKRSRDKGDKTHLVEDYPTNAEVCGDEEAGGVRFDPAQ